jgi:hypothetical protein
MKTDSQKKPARLMDSSQRIHVSMYPRNLILNPQKLSRLNLRLPTPGFQEKSPSPGRMGRRRGKLMGFRVEEFGGGQVDLQSASQRPAEAI